MGKYGKPVKRRSGDAAYGVALLGWDNTEDSGIRTLGRALCGTRFYTALPYSQEGTDLVRKAVRELKTKAETLRYQAAELGNTYPDLAWERVRLSRRADDLALALEARFWVLLHSYPAK